MLDDSQNSEKKKKLHSIFIVFLKYKILNQTAISKT